MAVIDTIQHVEEQLKSGSMTVQQLCGALGCSTDFEIIQSIAILEFENKIKTSGYEQVFREDGGAILMAKYSLA